MPPDVSLSLIRPLSRRAFLRTVAVGAGAALVGRGLTPIAAHAEDEGGTATLKAIPITYVPAPLSLKGTLSWTVTRMRTDTFSLSSKVDTSVSFTFDTSFDSSTFTSSDSRTFKQSSSVSLASAVTTRDLQTETYSSQSNQGPANYATVDDATFASLVFPQIGFAGNLNKGFRFRFVFADSILVCSALDLSPNGIRGIRDFLGATTADAIRSIYPLSAGALSGRQLGLGKPRFKRRKLIIAGPTSSPYQYINTVASGSTVTLTTTDTLSIEIKDSVGFKSTDPATQDKLTTMFGVGSTLTLTIAGSEEITNQVIYTTSGTITNDATALVHFRWLDRLYKTDLLTLEGTVTDFPGAVQAAVSNPDGTPMQGAIAGLLNGGESYEAVTGADGTCLIVTPEVLPAGTYTVACGDQTSSVFLDGSGTVVGASFSPDPTQAGSPPGSAALDVIDS